MDRPPGLGRLPWPIIIIPLQEPMPLPKNSSFKAGSRTVLVKVDPDHEHDGSYLTDKGKRQIIISDPENYEALLHEMLHVVDDDFGLGLKEEGVRALETALATLIHDNPRFMMRVFRGICPT